MVPLDIRLDFRSNIPIYLQVVEQVRQRMADGSLKKGDQLPTVRQLATELRINFNTIARAYRILDEERLISTQRGRGTYIWEEPSAEMLENLHQRSLEEIARQYLGEAVRLGFAHAEAMEAVNKIAASNWEDAETGEPREEV